jgi:hypothetical protein
MVLSEPARRPGTWFWPPFSAIYAGFYTLRPSSPDSAYTVENRQSDIVRLNMACRLTSVWRMGRKGKLRSYTTYIPAAQLKGRRVINCMQEARVQLHAQSVSVRASGLDLDLEHHARVLA